MGAVVLNTKSGADMRLIVALARKLKIDVIPLSPEEIEEIEDRKLLQSMLEAREEGLANRDEMLKKLDL